MTSMDTTAAAPMPPADVPAAPAVAAPSKLQPLLKAPEVLFANAQQETKFYWDRSHYDSPGAQLNALESSSTLYIGNLAFSTRSHHIRSHFAQLGPVRNVVLGLDRYKKTPCGFAFVQYAHREDALLAIAILSGTKLDGRVIRVELDAGFQQGRQYGRGKGGGQVRDDRRNRVDPGRQAKAKLNWTPPQQQQQQQYGGTNPEDGMNYYGSGDKGPPPDGDMGGADKNPRFRHD